MMENPPEDGGLRGWGGKSGKGKRWRLLRSKKLTRKSEKCKFLKDVGNNKVKQLLFGLIELPSDTKKKGKKDVKITKDDD
mgnify:CR=1 FL=1